MHYSWENLPGSAFLFLLDFGYGPNIEKWRFWAKQLSIYRLVIIVKTFGMDQFYGFSICGANLFEYVITNLRY